MAEDGGDREGHDATYEQRRSDMRHDGGLGGRAERDATEEQVAAVERPRTRRRTGRKSGIRRHGGASRGDGAR
jgi:hypothetical protein